MVAADFRKSWSNRSEPITALSMHKDCMCLRKCALYPCAQVQPGWRIRSAAVRLLFLCSDASTWVCSALVAASNRQSMHVWPAMHSVVSTDYGRLQLWTTPFPHSYNQCVPTRCHPFFVCMQKNRNARLIPVSLTCSRLYIANWKMFAICVGQGYVPQLMFSKSKRQQLWVPLIEKVRSYALPLVHHKDYHASEHQRTR